MKPFTERTLSTAISEAVLEKEGVIGLRLKGNCMWPVVQNGDKLLIEKRPFSGLKPGDVAVFRTSEETFHANTCFRSAKPGTPAPGNYLGAVREIQRNGKTIIMDRRSKIKILADLALSPANPYGLGIGKTLRRIILRQESRQPRS